MLSPSVYTFFGILSCNRFRSRRLAAIFDLCDGSQNLPLLLILRLAVAWSNSTPINLYIIGKVSV